MLTSTELHWYSGDLDQWDEGLHPGRTTYTSIVKDAEDQRLLLSYQALVEDGMLTLTDLALFKAGLKNELPASYLTLDTTFGIYENTLQLLLRDTHPLRATFARFVLLAWRSNSIQLSENFGRNPLYPAQFVCSVQLQVTVYW